MGILRQTCFGTKEFDFLLEFLQNVGLDSVPVQLFGTQSDVVRVHVDILGDLHDQQFMAIEIHRLAVGRHAPLVCFEVGKFEHELAKGKLSDEDKSVVRLVVLKFANLLADDLLDIRDVGEGNDHHAFRSVLEHAQDLIW